VIDLIVPEAQPTVELIWQGKVVQVQRENFKIFGIESTREIVIHPGAVGVVAVNEHQQIAMLRQYRRPVRAFLFEPVAGLLDKNLEFPLDAAKRELVEEAGLVASRWSHLIDLTVSPGGSSEVIRFFLAEEVERAPAGRSWSMESEEKELPLVWLSQDEFLAAVRANHIHNSPGIAAIFTAFETLKTPDRRDPNIPWPMFENLKKSSGISTISVDPNK
jgi:8-oxo-dGDP phosphatase